MKSLRERKDWFTSDTHFGHENIIKYDRRPFDSIEQHDEELIARWNDVVRPGDLVYHLGDFSWSKYNTRVDWLLSRLQGVKVLIYGNHDSYAVKKCPRWNNVTPYHEIWVGDQKICLFHYRMVVWNLSHRGSWALHGHSHGTLPVNRKAKTFDVGTMLWEYTPVSFQQLQDVLQYHTWEPVDGHGVEQARDASSQDDGDSYSAGR